MTDAQQLSSGELGRSLVRIEGAVQALSIALEQQHHRLRQDMTPMLKSIVVLETQMENVQETVAEHDTAITETKIQAGKITLAGTFLAIVAALIPWPWKVR